MWSLWSIGLYLEEIPSAVIQFVRLIVDLYMSL